MQEMLLDQLYWVARKGRDLCAGAVVKAALQLLTAAEYGGAGALTQHVHCAVLAFASQGDFVCYTCACTGTKAKPDLRVTGCELSLPLRHGPSMLRACGGAGGHTRWPWPRGKDSLETASGTVSVW